METVLAIIGFSLSGPLQEKVRGAEHGGKEAIFVHRGGQNAVVNEDGADGQSTWIGKPVDFFADFIHDSRVDPRASFDLNDIHGLAELQQKVYLTTAVIRAAYAGNFPVRGGGEDERPLQPKRPDD